MNHINKYNEHFEQNVEDKDPKDIFISLIGREIVNYIHDNNWVKFSRKPFNIYKRNIISMNFLEKDGKGDTVIFFGIHYDEDLNEWFSSNCIDYPDMVFKTYDEMVQHVLDIEDEIIQNGFSFPNLQ